MVHSDPSLRTLDKGDHTIRATLAIIPLNNDWSIVRHTESESIIIDRMLAKAAENKYDGGEDAFSGTQRLKRPMNAVMAYAQRRRPMISNHYPNLLTAGVSRILGYEWSTLLPKEEKDYWTELQRKVGEAYRERYPEYDYGSKRSESPRLLGRMPTRVGFRARPARSSKSNTNVSTTRTSSAPSGLSAASTSAADQYDPIPSLRPVYAKRLDPKSSVHHVLFSQSKLRRSVPRTTYEQNPSVISRDAAGGFTVIPPPASPSFPIISLDMTPALGPDRSNLSKQTLRINPHSPRPRMDSILPLPVHAPSVILDGRSHPNMIDGEASSVMVTSPKLPCLSYASVLSPLHPAQQGQPVSCFPLPCRTPLDCQNDNQSSTIYTTESLAYPLRSASWMSVANPFSLDKGYASSRHQSSPWRLASVHCSSQSIPDHRVCDLFVSAAEAGSAPTLPSPYQGSPTRTSHRQNPVPSSRGITNPITALDISISPQLAPIMPNAMGCNLYAKQRAVSSEGSIPHTRVDHHHIQRILTPSSFPGPALPLPGCPWQIANTTAELSETRSLHHRFTSIKPAHTQSSKSRYCQTPNAGLSTNMLSLYRNQTTQAQMPQLDRFPNLLTYLEAEIFPRLPPIPSKCTVPLDSNTYSFANISNIE